MEYEYLEWSWELHHKARYFSSAGVPVGAATSWKITRWLRAPFTPQVCVPAIDGAGTPPGRCRTVDSRSFQDKVVALALFAKWRYTDKCGLRGCSVVSKHE
jgi:hypothetical protein